MLECGWLSVMLTFRLIPSKLSKLNANKTLLLRCLPAESLRKIHTAVFRGSNRVQDYFLKFQA